MSILVTGGVGYIGSHTVVELLELGKDVVIVDDLSNASEKVVDRIETITGKRPTFYQLDVADKDALRSVFEKETIEAAIHFAAHKAVGESVQKPTMYYRNNLMSILSLVEVMGEFGVKKIVFSSSATVYGGFNPSPILKACPLVYRQALMVRQRSCVSKFCVTCMYRIKTGLSHCFVISTQSEHMNLV